jgi:calcineurin-like phosphoesterase family protein
MTIYFGADWHLGHKRILDFQKNRKFPDVDAMGEALLAELQAKVKYGDEVFLLGDIVYSNASYWKDKLFALQMPLNLVYGNHDSNSTRTDRRWASSVPYGEIVQDGIRIIMCHYPIESWSGQSNGTVHLHGHTHNGASHAVQSIPNRFDVGYDATKSALVTLEQLLERQNEQKKPTCTCDLIPDDGC